MPGIGLGLGTSRTVNPTALATHRILTITDSGSSARVTTAAAHGLTTGNDVLITGNSVAAYNGTTTSVTVVSGTVFDCDLSYTTDGAGGSWALA